MACDILKPEIEYLTKDDGDFVYKEYLEFALHEDPPKMKAVIKERVEELKGKVDALFLGYAICSSLEKITDELSVPTVMLPGSDCIEALLGSEEYAAEKKTCAGTWFCTPGWALEGTNGLIKELHLDSMEGFEPSFFFDIIFASYERTLFIDDGIGDEAKYKQLAQNFCDELKLRLDCRCCNLDRIKTAIEDTKKLGRNITGE